MPHRPALRPARLRPPARATRVAALALLTMLAIGACRASGEERAAAAGTAAPGASSTAAGSATAAAPGAMPADSAALRAAADSGRILGSPGATVWLLMISDFQCPFCKTWHDQSFETLRREYVETGKARMAYLHFPLDQHEQAMPTAEAAMCASAQGRFWQYQSALFGAAERWGQPGDQSAVYDSLATAVGVDLARFRSCTRSHVMRALIEADKDRMSRAGVQSTPSFFVGDQGLAGAQPLPVFRRALDAALAGTPAAPGR